MPRKIFIAVPSRDDAVMVSTMNCILGETIEMQRRGWEASIGGYGGINPVHTARNRAVAEFMLSDADDLLFWDDDVLCPKGKTVHLLDLPVDFVGGATPHKMMTPSFPVRRMPGDMVANEHGLIAVDGLPFGLVRLSRACVEAMVREYAHLHYKSPQLPEGGGWRLFSFDMVDGQDRSEDFMFCKRWNDIGGTVWCDPNIDFVHIGKHAYAGNFDQYLRAHPTFSREYRPRDAAPPSITPAQSAA